MESSSSCKRRGESSPRPCATYTALQAPSICPFEWAAKLCAIHVLMHLKNWGGGRVEGCTWNEVNTRGKEGGKSWPCHAYGEMPRHIRPIRLCTSDARKKQTREVKAHAGALSGCPALGASVSGTNHLERGRGQRFLKDALRVDSFRGAACRKNNGARALGWTQIAYQLSAAH